MKKFWVATLGENQLWEEIIKISYITISIINLYVEIERITNKNLTILFKQFK